VATVVVTVDRARVGRARHDRAATAGATVRALVVQGVRRVATVGRVSVVPVVDRVATAGHARVVRVVQASRQGDRHPVVG
jgi:hypothetical protein